MIYDADDYDRLPDLANTLEFADNPDQRTPCILALDTSYSMSGKPIAELNEGLKVFQQELMSDPLARRRVEVAVLTFGGSVALVQDFVTAEAFTPPVLSVNGGTPMGAGIEEALDRVAGRKAVYREAGVPHTRPWVFLVTDGAPTDDWRVAAERVREESANRRVAFFAVGVENADMQVLAKIAHPDRPPVRLAGLKFREMFQWLSASMSQVSRSAAGQQVALASPDGWTQV